MKIKNVGPQVVKADNKQAAPVKSKVTRGKDLRAGK